MRILGPLDRNRDDVVVVQNLDGALRAAGAVCDDDHCRATLSCAPDISNPVCYPAVELHGRLAADLMHPAVLNRQLLEARPGRRAHGERVPIHKRLFGRRRNDVPPSLCLLIAALQLVAEFDRLLTNEVQLRDEPVRTARCSGHEVDDRDQRLAVVESLARGDESARDRSALSIVESQDRNGGSSRPCRRRIPRVQVRGQSLETRRRFLREWRRHRARRRGLRA